MNTSLEHITYRHWPQALVLGFLLLMGWTTTLHAQASDANAEQGVLIVSVLPDSPAAAANIVRGDIILAANGEAVNDPLVLIEVIQSAGPGESVELTILHGDEERVVEVTLAERDGLAFLGVRPYIDTTRMAPGEMMQGMTMLGVVIPEAEEATEPDAEQSTPVAGAAVVTVGEGTPAETAGLQPGDVIISVDGEAVTDAESLVERIGDYAPDDEVLLEIVSPAMDTDSGDEAGEQETTLITVTLAAHPDDADRAYLGVQVVSVAALAEGVTLDEENIFKATPYRIVPGYPMPRGGYMYPAPDDDTPDYEQNGPRAYRFWMRPHRPHRHHHHPHDHRFHHPYPGVPLWDTPNTDNCPHNSRYDSR